MKNDPGNQLMSLAYALELEDITKDFPGVRALNHVTIRVHRGEIHCLLGENGAGKSTLMKILDGCYPAGSYEGEIRLNGEPLELRSPHDARRRGIGFVPQEINVIEPLSVAENIFVGNLNEGGGILYHAGRLVARASSFLNQHNINLDPGKKVSTLSTSQRQLVMIARALCANPSVLILDEPTSSLTVDETANLFRILRRLKQSGTTILFISHKLDEIFEMGDRVTVLRDGAAVARFDKGAFNPDDLITAMVGRKIENLFPPRDFEVGAEEVLRVEDLSVPHPRLKNKNLVEQISFSVRRGEVLGIAGLVGSGRSEVVNAIYGRIPRRGRVFVEGREVPTNSPRMAQRCGIGLVTEDRNRDGLLFNFAVRENITLHRLRAVSRLGVLNKRAESQRAAEYMTRLAIHAPSVSTPVLNLSGGNQQKVLLAKALFAQPKVLLLDEPTKGVDVGARHEVYQLMSELTRQGICLAVISSEFPEVVGLCDRVIVLARGKLTDSFARREASEYRLMRAATGVSEAIPTLTWHADS